MENTLENNSTNQRIIDAAVAGKVMSLNGCSMTIKAVEKKYADANRDSVYAVAITFEGRENPISSLELCQLDGAENFTIN